MTSHAVTCKTAALTLGLVAVLQTLQLRCLPPSQGKCQQTLSLHACTGVRTGTGVRAFSNMQCHHRQSAAQCGKASLQARHDTSMQPHTSTDTVSMHTQSAMVHVSAMPPAETQQQARIYARISTTPKQSSPSPLMLQRWPQACLAHPDCSW